MERSSTLTDRTAPTAARARRQTPAILLDRDGVINRDLGYVARIADFEFLPGVFAALRALAAGGFRLIVVTNQSGIGRGLYSPADFQTLNDWMLAQLRGEGVEIAAVYHCPHAPEANCGCRKPAPGLLLEAARAHRLDLARSWLVGDKPSDIEAARRAGVGRAVLVRSGQPLAPCCDADHVCDSLADLPQLIVRCEALL